MKGRGNAGVRISCSLLTALYALLAIRSSAQEMRAGTFQEGMVKVNGTELYYKTMGSGMPLVILHGGPGLDHSYLLPQLGYLARKYKLIFYDQRAMGRSSADVDTNSMTLNTLVEDVEGIRQAFHLEKMNLLGHSWGGLLAMFYARAHPNNLNSLLLINSTPASSEIRDASFAVMARRTSREDSIAQAGITQSEAFRKRSPRAMTDFFRLLFRGTFYDRRYADSLTLTFDDSYAKRSRILRYLSRDTNLVRYDIHNALEGISCPTLILSGDHDPVPQGSNETIHKHINGSIYVLLRNCGHFPYIEAQREFFAAVEGFLKERVH